MLAWSQLKALADDKIYVTQKFKISMGRVENIMEKGENAGFQHFLPFPYNFAKAIYAGWLKVGIVYIKELDIIRHCKS